MATQGKPRFGRLSAAQTNENIEKIRVLLHEDRRWTISKLKELSGLSWSTIQPILNEDLEAIRLAAKFVPRFLTRIKRTLACRPVLI